MYVECTRNVSVHGGSLSRCTVFRYNTVLLRCTSRACAFVCACVCVCVFVIHCTQTTPRIVLNVPQSQTPSSYILSHEHWHPCSQTTQVPRFSPNLVASQAWHRPEDIASQSGACVTKAFANDARKSIHPKNASCCHTRNARTPLIMQRGVRGERQHPQSKHPTASCTYVHTLHLP